MIQATFDVPCLLSHRSCIRNTVNGKAAIDVRGE